MRRRIALAASSALVAGCSLALAPAASAVQTFDPCSPSIGSAAAEHSNRQAGPPGFTSGVWLVYPAADAFRPGSVGQQIDKNGDGWICAWTPYGKFNPDDLSPLLVKDNPHPLGP